MKKLIVYYGDAPVYAEGFCKDCDRSCKGALHILPRKKMEVTDGEYEHLVKKYPHVMPKLRVMAEMKAEAKPEAVEEAPKPESEKPKKEKKEKKFW